jgi:hypothetical protein
MRDLYNQFRYRQWKKCEANGRGVRKRGALFRAAVVRVAEKSHLIRCLRSRVPCLLFGGVGQAVPQARPFGPQRHNHIPKTSLDSRNSAWFDGRTLKTIVEGIMKDVKKQARRTWLRALKALPLIAAAWGIAGLAAGTAAHAAAATGEPYLVGVSGPLTGQDGQYGTQWKHQGPPACV